MVVTGKAGGLCPSFSSNEDECRDAPGRLEKGLEGILFPAFRLETIPLGILADPDQPNRLSSFSTDTAPVYEGEDSGGQAKISQVKEWQMSKGPKFKWSKGTTLVAFNSAIPAEEGIQGIDFWVLDSRFHGNDTLIS